MAEGESVFTFYQQVEELLEIGIISRKKRDGLLFFVKENYLEHNATLVRNKIILRLIKQLRPNKLKEVDWSEYYFNTVKWKIWSSKFPKEKVLLGENYRKKIKNLLLKKATCAQLFKEVIEFEKLLLENIFLLEYYNIVRIFKEEMEENKNIGLRLFELLGFQGSEEIIKHLHYRA